ncbi:glycosyltransferase family 4 protein [Chitinophaga pendula]|uniref:glycosyltransferase family 4 protein n=1 Tax=Chitinophaga TaxID=79328 RepID=UPI0012FE34B0|nr:MULTISPECIES: glycosyltransferase family 4 protein [Chitinophaga]UCJ06329.1 glycosyltransferase family 4 protein [Chitinophaga pendula]
MEVAFLSSLPALNKTFDLRVIVLGKITPGLEATISEEDRACLYSFDYALWLLPACLYRVLSFALKFRPEILICSLWRSSLMGTFIKRFMPRTHFISFIHNTFFFHKLDAFFTKSAIRAADSIFVDAISTADFVKNIHQVEAPVCVISFLKTSTGSYQRKSPVFAQEVKFLSLSRINKVKNIPAAVELIHMLRQQGINARFDIYGRDDGDIENVQNTIGRLQLQDVVHIKGEVRPDLANKLFEQYDFFLQLSVVEGMAMSVAEAMQNGLVCIVTPVGEIKNYSRDMESAIWADVADGKSMQAVVSKVMKVIADTGLYSQISENSHAKFENALEYKSSLISNITKRIP